MLENKKGGLGRGLGALVDVSADENRIAQVDINQITPNRKQPRRQFDEESLAELAESIRNHGLIQPIIVKTVPGGYEIVAGERRWRASRMAGLKELPCIVKTFTEKENLLVALIENLQREDLNPMDEAEAYAYMMSEFGMTQEEISENVGKSRPYVANALRLRKLPEQVRKMVEEKRISSGHGRALLSLPGEADQMEVANKIVAENLSVREAEELVRRWLSPKPTRTKSPDDTRFHAIEAEITDALGTKVKIREKNQKGTIQLSFYSKEELERLIEILSQPRI